MDRTLFLGMDDNRRMPSWFMIDGKRSDLDFGLKMDKCPLWASTAENIENIAIPGVPADRSRRTGQYQDFQLTLKCYLLRPFRPRGKTGRDIFFEQEMRDHNFQGELHRLNDAIQNGREVILSSQPELVGIIRKAGQITMKPIGSRANEVQIPLTFEPFKYSRRNDPKLLSESPATLRYKGNIYGEPVYRFTVAESEDGADFTVNGVALHLDCTGDITVDLPRRKIYKESDGILTIVQHQTAGAFWRMVLQPGENEITWSDAISDVSVTRNVRWL